MKKIKNKLICLASFAVLLQPTIINADKTPTFDSDGAKNATNGFMTPFMDFALWAVPVTTGVVWVVAGLMWLCKEEDEREQKPFAKTSKRIITVGIIATCVPAFLKIFGIS